MINIRKDIQIAWALFKVLEEEPQKTEYYIHKIYTKYNMNVSLSCFRKLITALANKELLIARTSVGIYKSKKRIIYLTDIMDAFGIEIIDPEGPVKFVKDKLMTAISDCYICNYALGENINDNKVE